MIKLDQKQKDVLMSLIKYYDRIYVCNKCGSVYGSDYHDRNLLCPVCEIKLKGGKKKNE